MSAPRFAWDARNHRLEAGSTPAPPSAGGEKLSPPLGISGLRAILRVWFRFINLKGLTWSDLV